MSTAGGGTPGRSNRPPAGREPAPAPSPRGGGVPQVEPGRQRLIGLALVVAAVLIGVLLVARGLGEDEPVVGVAVEDPEVTTTEDRDAPPTIDPESIDTPSAPEPGEVTVLVANGKGVVGLAAQVSESLTGDGFEVVTPADAPPTEATSVYYSDGNEAGAQVVAEALGLAASVVAPLPDPAPLTDPLLARNAGVVVVLGADFNA